MKLSICDEEKEDWFKEIENDQNSISDIRSTPIKHSFALFHYYLLKGFTFDDALKHVLPSTNDHCPNASLVCSMMGAAYGFGSIKEEWKTKINEMEESANFDFLSPSKVIPSSIDSLLEILPKKLVVVLNNKSFEGDGLKQFMERIRNNFIQ